MKIRKYLPSYYPNNYLNSNFTIYTDLFSFSSYDQYCNFNYDFNFRALKAFFLPTNIVNEIHNNVTLFYHNYINNNDIHTFINILNHNIIINFNNNYLIHIDHPSFTKYNLYSTIINYFSTYLSSDDH